MTPEEINALLELQALDLKLIEYEEHQKALPGLIEEIEAPARAARAAREKVEAELEVAKAHQRQIETDLVVNNDNFKKLQTKQMAVRNQIELEAFQHELDALKDRADVLADTGLRWVEAAEIASEQLPPLVEAAEAADKAAAEQRAALDAKTEELRRIHDEAAQLQAPFLELVPNQVLAYYKRLRGAGKSPFAAVVRKGACSGCGFRHPPQKLQEIKKARRMMTCEQCGRIQVWREDEEEKIGF